jgi:type I restriction enzyme M protein
MPTFGKTNALLESHFEEFERLFGADPGGKSKREDEGENGRWRKLSREQIAERGDNLNWLWLRDESGEQDDSLQDPNEILAAIIGHLRSALNEIDALNAEVEGDDFQLKPAI